ncbi:Nn.00g030160.m01.CDS01 [Neocucurbitaria sp. VM-36]
MTMFTPTSISPLHSEWETYDHTLTRNKEEIHHLDSEVDRALLRISAEEQALLNNEFRRSNQIADKKRILYAARNASARAQRRLDRLQTKVGCWDKLKCSPTTPMTEMQGRSAMDIFKEIEESLEDAMLELQEVSNAESNAVC